MVTKEMICAAHDICLKKGDFVLSASLLERIYLAMRDKADGRDSAGWDAYEDLRKASDEMVLNLRQRVQDLEKQRDELLSDLAEAKRSAEFNFEQYQDVGRLLHEECEKTEKLLSALEKCRKELSAWMRDHGDDIATQEAVADARAAIASVKELK